MRREALKRLPMPSAAPLSAEALALAISRVAGEPNDGWADLVVHPSQLRPAMKLARESKSDLQVRVLCESVLGINGWMLRTRTAEVVNL